MKIIIVIVIIIIIVSRGDSPGKTVYMEKNHPTLVISHLRCGEISPGWDESILIHNDLFLKSGIHHSACIALW